MPELPEAERARLTLEGAIGREIVAVDDRDTYVCRPHRPGRDRRRADRAHARRRLSAGQVPLGRDGGRADARSASRNGRADPARPRRHDPLGPLHRGVRRRGPARAARQAPPRPRGAQPGLHPRRARRRDSGPGGVSPPDRHRPRARQGPAAGPRRDLRRGQPARRPGALAGPDRAGPDRLLALGGRTGPPAARAAGRRTQRHPPGRSPHGSVRARAPRGRAARATAIRSRGPGSAGARPTGARNARPDGQPAPGARAGPHGRGLRPRGRHLRATDGPGRRRRRRSSCACAGRPWSTCARDRPTATGSGPGRRTRWRSASRPPRVSPRRSCTAWPTGEPSTTTTRWPPTGPNSPPAASSD